MAKSSQHLGNAKKHCDEHDFEGRFPLSNELTHPIREFGEEFSDNPLQYTVEAEIRGALKGYISNDLDDRETTIYGSVFERKNQYKEPYERALCQPVDTDTVHSEVNIGTPSSCDDETSDIDGLISFEGGTRNRSVDIVVMKDGQQSVLHPLFDIEGRERVLGIHELGSQNVIEVALDSGTKYFPPEAIDYAIEVKYVKNKATASVDDHGRWEKVESDVEKLSNLRSVASNGTSDPPECHLVIFTNYDPFRLADINKHKDREEYRDRFRDMIGWCAEKNIHVWEFHPANLQ